MYLPTLKNARPVYHYQIGSYIAVVVTDCESVGMISYTHVLFLLEPRKQEPIFAVAAELNSFTASISTERLFLGVFNGQGHLNLGMSEDWADLDKFTARALKIVTDHFKITETPHPLADPRLN